MLSVPSPLLPCWLPSTARWTEGHANLCQVIEKQIGERKCIELKRV